MPTQSPLTPLTLERTTFGWRVKSPKITTPLVWRVIQGPPILRLCTVFPLPNAASASAPASKSLEEKKRKSKQKPSTSSDSGLESSSAQEELERASLKLIWLTRRVLASTSRPCTTTLSSPRWISLRKKRIALFKLCKELQRENSSESETKSEGNPVSSETNSSGQSDTSGPRLWRPFDTADNLSLRPVEKSPQVSSPPGLCNAHRPDEVQVLTEQLQERLRSPFSAVGALDLRTSRR
jgi:hypothetical protein